MKPLKVNLIFLVSLILTCSCNKEELTETVSKNETGQFVLDKVPYIVNPYDVSLYTKNEEDIDDEKINIQLLDIAIATRDFLKESPQTQTVLRKANTSANSSINLFDLVIKEPLKSSSQSSTYSKLVSLLKNADLKHSSTNPLKSGVIEEYIPAIYVPNAGIADMNKQPIVGVGFEINTELPGMEEYEDNIVAWYYDENDKLNEILLNEETAIHTTNPVFIICNAEEEFTELNKSAVQYQSTLPETSILKSTNKSLEYHSCEYQINHRYENSGKSEFCICAAHIDENGTAHNTLIKDNGTYTSWKKIADVDKDDIGDLLSHWEQFISIDVTPHTTNYTFWNTFERDWYASAKNLGWATANGTTIYIGGNLKYSNEWYAYEPSEVHNNRVDYPTIYSYWAKWHDNSKGRFRIWRVEL